MTSTDVTCDKVNSKQPSIQKTPAVSSVRETRVLVKRENSDGLYLVWKCILATEEKKNSILYITCKRMRKLINKS